MMRISDREDISPPTEADALPCPPVRKCVEEK